MGTYKIERSNIEFARDQKSMICTFTITQIETQEKHVYNNIFVARDNAEAFLIFPATNEVVYINREKEIPSNRIKKMAANKKKQQKNTAEKR